MPNIGNDMILRVKLFEGEFASTSYINDFLESGSEDEIDIKLVVDIRTIKDGIMVIYYEPIKD